MNPKTMKVIPPDIKLDKTTKPRVLTYDFRRPDKFSKEQLRSFTIVHDQFKDTMTTKLCQALRMHIDIKMPEVAQLTFEEFTRSLPENPAIGIIDMKPIKTHAALSIDPLIVQSFMNRAFGGNGIPREEEKTRTISELEALVLRRIFKLATETLNMKPCWGFILPLEAELKSIENHPKFVQIVPPPEMGILASMECRIGELSGFINFFVPYLAIEPVLHKFSAAYFYSTLPKNRNKTAEAHIPDLPMAAQVYYQTPKYSLTEISAILEGKEIEIDAEQEYILSAGDVPLLTLKPDKDGSFSVPDSRALRQSLDSFLHPEPTDTAANENQGASGLMKEISSLKTYLDKRFTDLESRQNELADQFVFQENIDLSDSVKRPASSRPFSFVSKGDAADLSAILNWENPQAAAVVLSYLDPGITAALLEFFDDEKQASLVSRIAVLDRIAPEILSEMENLYYRKLKDMASHEMYRAGGLQAAVQILNMSARSLEKNVVENFERNQPDLAEQIKQNMFVFEDIVLLDKKACQLTVQKAKRRDLLLALKMVDEPIKEYIRSCVSDKEWSDIETGLKDLGRVRLTEIETAQVAVVNTIRVLEDNGEIMIARAGEIVE